MKEETVQSLIVARTLFDKAHELCATDDKYVTSAGLLVLQDAVELVIHSCLIEMEIDNLKNLDNISFDQKLSELKKALGANGGNIIKPQKLKAMNKERVIVKHYGHLSEPVTVRNFFDSAVASIDNMLEQIVGKNLQEIMLHEVLKESKAKEYIKQACVDIEKEKWYEALINVRKAIFLEIEIDYSIEGWKEIFSHDNRFYSLYNTYYLGGIKAPHHKKCKEWIGQNVFEPFDYIQLDIEKVRLDLIEWGASTQDFWNVSRLTPKTFNFKDSERWVIENSNAHIIDGANEQNAKYCLDRAVSLIVKKQNHMNQTRYLKNFGLREFKIRIKENTPLLMKASINADVLEMLEKDSIWNANKFMNNGLEGTTGFIKITSATSNADGSLSNTKIGYIVASSCEIIETENQ